MIEAALETKNVVCEHQAPTAKLLETVFNRCFAESENTLLKPGGEEPVYLPAKHNTRALIVSTHDYASSALHEVAHWCIAGKARRELMDYGYWYEPDGRSAEQQREFERVEVKPQALEWVFSVSCGLKFRLSVDNLADPFAAPSKAFKERVAEQAQRYWAGELPRRAGIFSRALQAYFSVEPEKLALGTFSVSNLA